MSKKQMTTLPDADIQLLFRSTGRLGTISTVEFVNQVASLASDISSSTSTLPLLPGNNIEFTTDPVTGFTVIGQIDDPDFDEVNSTLLNLDPSIPAAGGVVGQVLFVDPLASDTLAGRLAGDNGTASASGNPYTLLDFNPSDLVAGQGITITATDTTATIALDGSLPATSSMELFNPIDPTVVSTLGVGVDGDLFISPDGGPAEALLTTENVLAGVDGLAPGSQLMMQSYLIDVAASTATGYAAINDPLVPTGIHLVSPAVVVTPPAIVGPLAVTIVFDEPFTAGYSTTLTPVNSPSLIAPFQAPTLTINPLLSNLNQVTFNVENVILPLTLPILGTIINNPTIPIPIPAIDYAFAVEVTVIGV